MMPRDFPVIFDFGVRGRVGSSYPAPAVPDAPLEQLVPAAYLRKQPAALPEVSELDVVRHYTRLSHRNFSIDEGFYPLGSCTMKYNPKIHEDAARLPGFARLHPYVPAEHAQGALRLMWELEQLLAEISGMDRVTFQPAAGAHGELTGLLMIRAYFAARGERRTKVIVPDSAHGTNPATASMVGYQVVTVKSDARGNMDVRALREAMDDSVAAIMLTNPNTLGLFEERILDVEEIVHDAGGQLYLDGANFNAVLGVTRPGDQGFDVMHMNLHKTFTTPHGGGGPGAGAVGVTTKDMAKRMLDSGFHAPTIYFPLIVEEAIMIEPTETESKRTLDEFADAMQAIAREAQDEPDVVRTAPHSTPVRRLDEVRAARQPDLRWKPR